MSEPRSRKCQTSLQQPGHSGLFMRMRSLSPYKTVPWNPITSTRHLVKILTGHHQSTPQTKTLVSELWKSTSTFCLPTRMCTYRENLICMNKFHLHKLNVYCTIICGSQQACGVCNRKDEPLLKVLKLPCPLGLRDYILGSEENIQRLLCN